MKRWAGWIAAAAAIQLSWTNPSINKDGTACHDLAFMRFRVRNQYYSVSYQRDYPVLGREGLVDSVQFAVPCTSGSPSTASWWQFVCFPVDTAGNVGDSSNVIAIYHTGS